MTPRTPTPWFIIAFSVVLAFHGAFFVPASGSPYFVQEGGDATRIVTWNMTGPEGVTSQNVSFESNRAGLAWEPATVAWTQGFQFAGNGTLDANLSANVMGITLRPDPYEYVADGNFSIPGPWAYTNSSSERVVAEWQPAFQDVEMGHRSDASPQTQYDSLDALNSNWSIASSLDSSSDVSPSPFRNEGVGSMKDHVDIGSATDSYAGVQRNGLVDWSRGDRLLVWINSPPLVLTLYFSITAVSGSTPYGTSPQALGVGWQPISVDLNELGPSRDALSAVTFRFTGPTVIADVYLDDIRLTTSKQLNESADLEQSFSKGVQSSSSPGTAVLSFKYEIVNATGVDIFSAIASMSGPLSFLQWQLPVADVGSWRSFWADVSSGTTEVGTYVFTLTVGISLNTTTSSDARIRIDNVSLLFPNRHNGTYLSNPVDLGVLSETLSLSWAGDIPEATSLVVRVRAGNSSDERSANWTTWSLWTTPGTYEANFPAVRYVQLAADMGTLNSSRSPQFRTFVLDTRHRYASGLVTTLPYQAPSEFLQWRSFTATWEGASPSSIAFQLYNGSVWSPVGASADLSWNRASQIQVKAILSTPDGLRSPSLIELKLAFEYLGAPASLTVWPNALIRLQTGYKFQFYAAAFDAGGHNVTGARLRWSTDNPGGRINDTGLFVAGDRGTWNVTVSVWDTAISRTFQVVVVPVPFDAAQILLNPYLLLALVALGAGCAAYKPMMRRMYSMEDLFVIAKDGRLIMHNTRRIRADQDEDILAGMLTAVSAFVRDSFKEENGDLRRFEFAGKTVLVERGADAYVAAIFTGRVPRWAGRDLRAFMMDLERSFGGALAAWSGSPEDLQELKQYTDRLVRRTRYHRRQSRERYAS